MSNYQPKGITFIIPILDDLLCVINLIKRINFFIDKLNISYEILIVDDSVKLSGRIVLNKFSKIKYLAGSKRGLKEAINKGFVNRKYRFVVIMDSDLSHDPVYIYKNIYLLSRYSLISFSRFKTLSCDRRKLKISGPLKIYSYFLNRLSKFTVSKFITDYTCGFYLFDSLVINKLPLNGFYGDYSLYFLENILLKKVRFIEVPIFFYDRTIGKSKTGIRHLQIISKGLRYIKALILIKIRQLSNY